MSDARTLIEDSKMPVIGTQQSPIRIDTWQSNRVRHPKQILKICYKRCQNARGHFDNPGTGHGNLVLHAPYPEIKFGGVPYCLRKVHIHLGSEHRLDSDTPSDFEVHLLHLPKGSDDDTDAKVVIGILYKHDPDSPTKGLERLIHELSSFEVTRSSPKQGDGDGSVATPDGVQIPLLELFPELCEGDVDVQNWFHYQGSLTSEPFSEDVAWFVMKSESKINKTKIGEVEKFAEQHARPVFPLNRRFILRSFD